MRGTNFKVLRIVTLFVKTNNFDSVNATRRPLFGKYVRTVLLTVDWIFFNFFFGLTLYLFNDGIFTTPWAWLMVNASFIPVIAFESRRSVSESRAIELDHVLRYTLNTIGIHALFLLSLTTLFDTHNLGAQFYVSYYVMLGVAVALWTLLSRHVIKKYRRRGMNFAKVVIVGTNTTAPKILMERLGMALEEASFATGLYFIFRTAGCFIGAFALRVVSPKLFFGVSVAMMAAAMVILFTAHSLGALYTGIALIGFGNSNVFSVVFSQALIAAPVEKNEVSGLMIMGLFGGTIFPLAMGYAADAVGQAGAVAVMAAGVVYLLYYTLKIKSIK